MTSIRNIYFLNQIGQRPQLEDNIYPPPGEATINDRLFLVCDGVGGENFGEEASRIACEEFPRYFKQTPPGNNRFDNTYITAAQTYVLEKMKQYTTQNAPAEKMSTTLTLVYIGSAGVSVAWCGDSRIYHLRDGKVRWHSEDHSLVNNLVKHGEILPEEAATHPKRNIITRSLNAHASASEIDVNFISDIKDGDYIMLCTDGVLEQITEPILNEVLLSDYPEKDELFLDYAGGKTKDNFSLYLIQLNEGKKRPGGIIYLLVAAITILIAALFFLAFNPQKNNRKPLPVHNSIQTQPSVAPGKLPIQSDSGNAITPPSNLPVNPPAHVKTQNKAGNKVSPSGTTSNGKDSGDVKLPHIH